MRRVQNSDPDVTAAFELGWQSYVQHERSAATERIGFEIVERELEQMWNLHRALGRNRLPWEKARESARDAWEQVQASLMDGPEPKVSAR